MSVVIENHNPNWDGENLFDKFRTLPGEEFRNIQNRRTYRFEDNGKSYFCKFHSGVGWAEIVKNFITLRLPVIGAANELRAIKRLTELGVETMTITAFGQRGSNPAKLESFIVTEELTNTVDLEELCKDWPRNKPLFQEKLNLLTKIAEVSKVLHENGICHRDYYICHFLLHEESLQSDPSSSISSLKLSLIDLHRALIKADLGERWKVKDIGGLYFSAMDIGLTQRDIYRFVRAYSGLPLREALSTRMSFWQQVNSRALKLYKKHH